MIAIIDYGMGNSGSILNMLTKLGVRSVITSDPLEISKAERLILPGVGSFDQGMDKMTSAGLIEVLEQCVWNKGIPIFGICLGMQMFGQGSEEGSKPGLGWIQARAIKFSWNDASQKRKVPHVGWNEVHWSKPSSVFSGIPVPARFYFVHSYHLQCAVDTDVALWSDYGGKFVAAIEHDNIIGTQFHPEKSHKFGLSLLERFAKWNPRERVV